MKCQSCDSEFERIGQHWALSSCEYPSIHKFDDMITGCLMGDGWIDTNGSNSCFGVGSKQKGYINYVYNSLGNLATNITTRNLDDSSSSGTGEFYIIRTVRHPQLDKYEDWYSSGKKVWPVDIELTPTVLKHWYCGDGHFDDTGTAHRISIALENEVNNKDKIENMFNEKGFEISNWGVGTITFSRSESERLWEYMGEPLSGFEYKWPSDL